MKRQGMNVQEIVDELKDRIAGHIDQAEKAVAKGQEHRTDRNLGAAQALIELGNDIDLPKKGKLWRNIW